MALTCDHVLAAAEGPYTLKSADSNDPEEVIGHERDPELDLAVLRVPSRDHRRWLALGPDPTTASVVLTRGFGRDHPLADFPDGYPKRAGVAGSTTVNWRGQLVVGLFVLTDIVADRGMSGAPVVDEETGSVLGILQLSDKASHEAFAIPASAAKLRWPSLDASGASQVTYARVTHTALPEALAARAWDAFNPERLHCVVVTSEGQAGCAAHESLLGLVRDVLNHPRAADVWSAFVGAHRDRDLVQGLTRRDLADEYRRANTRLASFDVLDAFASPASLDVAVRLIVEADLALFDVTDFEPGVMLLLGVRAATRRGVTINSHGKGWVEGEPLNRPFNLSDLSLASHTASESAGEDPRTTRMIDRIRTGFDQLARQPSYLDLPVYDALRRLGSEERAWTSIPLETEVLVLCSYDRRHLDTWRSLRSGLANALAAKDIRTTVSRLQDVATPQLVSQSLYERIRRCAGCVADWTLSSPSTFFELGVRLAVSPWSIVQIVDEGWLEELKSRRESAGQISRMAALFNPLGYRDVIDDEEAERIAEQLVEMRERIAGSRGHRVRQVAADALGRSQERLPNVVEQLRREADALSHSGRMRDNVPQALYYEVAMLKADEERAALERRLAAWLYLEHRVGAAQLDDADELKQLWRALAGLVASDLLGSDREVDQDLGLSMVEGAVSAEPDVDELERSATLQRRKGDIFVRRQRQDEARQAYVAGLSLLDRALDALLPSRDIDPAAVRASDASDAADLFGMRGGVLRRLSGIGDADALSEAVVSYRRGAAFEAAHGLTQTYSRANAIKVALIAGDRGLAELRSDIVALGDALQRRLRRDESAADDAWLWADLADMQLLLGQEADALSSYATFAAKARLDSPASTLAVITEVADALVSAQDPDAPTVAAAVANVEAQLSAS